MSEAAGTAGLADPRRPFRALPFAAVLCLLHVPCLGGDAAAPAAAGNDAALAAANHFAAPGPYPVGVRTVVLIDESRRDEFAGGPRTLVTEFWYPATDAARELPRAKFSEFFGRYSAEGARAIKRDLAEIDSAFHTEARRGAVLRAGRWPLLLFSHGNGGFRHQNAWQMEHLASHGYLVVAPDHTGNASLSPLPDRAVGYDKKGRLKSGEERPADIRFLIDRVTAGSDPLLSWVKGAADPGAIGILGHSFGGSTAVRLAGEEPRLKAILAMTVAFVGKPGSIPTLVMLGAQDRTVGLAGNLASRGYFLACTGPRYLFVMPRGGHFTFTEMALLNPNFGDGIGKGKDRDGREMEFIPVDLAKRMIDAYSLAFFERYLRGSDEAGKFLESNPWPEELEWWTGERRIPPESASKAGGAPPRKS